MVKKNPKISVVVPVYKVEEYLDYCVESIVNQTYKNLEIILVDDGSPDNCPKICDEWTKKDKRIRVVHKKNGGLSSARNAGIDSVTGDYISFVDSDDRLNLQTLEILISGSLNYDADISMCSWKKIYNIAEPNDDNYDLSDLKWENFKDNEVFDLLFNNKLPLIMAAWAKLYKTEIIKDIGYSTDYPIHEDEYTIHYVLDKAKSLTFVDLPLYDNLQRNTSITGTTYSEKRLYVVKAMQDRWNFCKENRSDFEQKALSKYLVTIAVSYSRFKKSKGNKEILKRLLVEFDRCYKLLKKRNIFIRLFKTNKTLAGVIVNARDKIKG